ncbi:uncharacterized protein LOC100256033 isoform X2 [Vitis vinifera]|uniref:uncharacterized protein LOC100256033 isoform X2 n=1 Tax=Vitis vinifera TaxID=29760 RepID=UPI00023B247A|nr:uncharacterized protein LOC100256033 isoform X2 [Vitis vinifera]XP_059593798.1 uncharacterized protein LOC100256033 isoform X2 [Vitis vinifera]
MGSCSREKNHGGNHNAIIRLVRSSESIHLPTFAWFSWSHHGFFMAVGSELGSFDLLVHICSGNGCHGITLNVHASITYMFTAIGVNTIPSMDLIYALFGTLLLLNSGFFVFLLHILYAVFLSRLGMKASLTMPRWLEKAI